MDYKYSKSNKSTKDVDMHLIGVFDNKQITHLDKWVSKSTHNLIKRIFTNNNFAGKLGDYRSFDDLENNVQILLFGLGNKTKFNPIIFNKVIGGIIKKVIKTKTKTLSINTENIIYSKTKTSYEMLITAIENAKYKYLHKKEKEIISLKTCVLSSKSTINIKKFSEYIKIGKALSNGISLAKDLGNTPPNICTPSFLSNEAKKLKKINKLLKVTVIEENKMKALGMGAFLAVSKGSKEPGKIVTIEYMPVKKKSPIVLIGKGITFDTGGISIKPSVNMDEMKFDMSGAGSVIGTMRSCAEMKIKTNIVGVIACSENMPGSQATRPGDVVKSMSGITIEILNTDAEGRLVLCDAITYAKKYKPRYMIDMATLTGACLVGLGKYPSGLFANNQELAELIKKSAEKTGDRVWQLPLYDDYFKELKTNFADIQNIGGRYGGAITAAAFLAKFTEGIKWAHLDIAGTAWEVGENKGSTGRPVSLLVDFIRSNQ